MKHINIIILSIGIISIILTGCTNNLNNEKKINVTKVTSKETLNDQSISNHVKELLVKEKEVRDVKAVNTDKEIIVDAAINHMDRFQLKDIEKRLTKMVEKENPNHKVTLSTDKKIFLELEKLEKEYRVLN